MRTLLAEQLLVKVMKWDVETITSERPLLQIMAEYKYDDYQQFYPGMRFIESLALWLSQFETIEEKTSAYQFIKTRLIYFSQVEMNHLVNMTYIDNIRPDLIKYTAEEMKLPKYYVSKILESKNFNILRRKCLFLALSDGGKIDVFRRSNPELSPEQIFLTHELTDSRIKSMQSELKIDIKKITGKEEDHKFQMIFLIDDFSGSGKTNIRKSIDGSCLEGKIVRFVNDIYNSETKISEIISKDKLHIGVRLYCATEQALNHTAELLKKLSSENEFEHSLNAIQIIRDVDLVGSTLDDKEFTKCIQKYYDSDVEDKHTKIGGTKDVRFGFSSCKLPLILFHNTPNNAIFLLWSYSKKIKGLFPRITRHGGEL